MGRDAQNAVSQCRFYRNHLVPPLSSVAHAPDGSEGEERISNRMNICTVLRPPGLSFAQKQKWERRKTQRNKKYQIVNPWKYQSLLFYSVEITDGINIYRSSCIFVSHFGHVLPLPSLAVFISHVSHFLWKLSFIRSCRIHILSATRTENLWRVFSSSPFVRFLFRALVAHLDSVY